MAKKPTPVFAQTTRHAQVRITTNNANRDGSGTVGTNIFLLFTAPADGALLMNFRAKATATTSTAGLVRIFTSIDGGSTKLFWGEIEIAAITVSDSVKSAEGELQPSIPMHCTASMLVYVTSSIAVVTDVHAEVGELT